MLKNISLKTAVAISLSLHLVAISPWSSILSGRKHAEDSQIEVTYILEDLLEDRIEEDIENIPQKYDLKEQETKQPEGKDETPQPKQEPSDTLISEEENRYLEEAEAERIEEYIAYYELIREKIKKFVKRYYRKHAEEGRVEVIFALRKAGSIESLEISQIRGAHPKYLEKIARKAVKSAAPFPPFPVSLKKDSLTFTISIIFKRG